MLYEHPKIPKHNRSALVTRSAAVSWCFRTLNAMRGGSTKATRPLLSAPTSAQRFLKSLPAAHAARPTRATMNKRYALRTHHWPAVSLPMQLVHVFRRAATVPESPPLLSPMSSKSHRSSSLGFPISANDRSAYFVFEPTLVSRPSSPSLPSLPPPPRARRPQ